MKFLIQRVTSGSVQIYDEEGKEKRKESIEKGFVVFVGVCEEDTREIADKMVKKMAGLRIFEDEQGKTNLALKDVNGSILLISQFTLYADCKKGYRPSFLKSGSPVHANEIYEYVIGKVKEHQIPLKLGEFGAYMKVEIHNDGPFTICLDSNEI